MNERFKKYLPIGSVVLLKNAKKRIMITGLIATSIEKEAKTFDYMGCLYPEGVIKSNESLLFNHDQIDKIYYIGYNDDEWKRIEFKLKEIVKNMEEEQ